MTPVEMVQLAYSSGALNTLVALTVTKALKMNKSSKAKTTDNSDLEN